MATVKIKTLREQAAHFGLYRTSVGGDDSIIVRRKVGEPTDYLHSKSRKLIRQRENLSLASHHYASLTPSQKAITRHQIKEVEFIRSHGKTDTKLLSGRQLFISKDMASLARTGLPIALPMELCIMLVDPQFNPLAGELWLRYLRDEQWLDIAKEELTTGNWLFSQVSADQEAYRPYGQALGYHDPELPEHQFMTKDEIRAYHYHTLIPELPRFCYRELQPHTAVILRQGTKYSQPFMPYCSFTLLEFWICLIRYPSDDYTPPATGFLSIHQTTGSAKPIDPPIANIPFNISVPNPDETRWHKIPFPSLILEADTLYAWVLGSPGEWDWYYAVLVPAGWYGLCNLDPTFGRWKSRYDEGHWSPWQDAGFYQMFYETRGQALP